MSDRHNKYIDLKVNGRLFPSWILANFPKYKLPDIIKKEGEDPCNMPREKGSEYELKLYQIFVSKYLDFRSPYRDILIYHGLGSGKTASAINIYNMLYNYTPAWNVFVLLKAALKDAPWMTDLEKFLKRDDIEHRFKNIVFVSYDSPIADKQFLDAVKNSDSSKKSLYIIEEAHNFIRNVYSNINSKKGKRAQTIYDYIINDKKENEGVRVVLLSGTPAVNKPYELALMFNLLRPGIFPKSEVVFNQIYVSSGSYQQLNESAKNLFQRRILGLITYYIGSTPDVFASKKTDYVDVEMSDFQTDVYNWFESEEDRINRSGKGKSGSQTYMTYTRQAANFVFPQISQSVTSEGRPRPGKFRISEKENEYLSVGKSHKLKLENDNQKAKNFQKYMSAISEYTTSFQKFLNDAENDDVKNKHTLHDDVKTFHDKYKDNFNEFNANEKNKSKLYTILYNSSAKMITVIFNILKSPGPVLVYTNYVLMEGLQIFKVYLNCFGFSLYSGNDKHTNGYVEFHGGIDKEQREKNRLAFNNIKNKHGDIIKIIMISSAGAEGISLANVRQVHIMEPYWNEGKMTQVIGRAIRQCSHKDLPIEDRHVDVFRYKSVKKKIFKSTKWTSDQTIEHLARSKEGLIQSFCEAMKEASIDCVLFKSHNMMRDEYKCFQFEEPSLFDEQIGPAYKEDVFDDMKINNGSNSQNSMTTRIKVMKIKAVIQLSEEDANGNAKYSEPKNYWLFFESGTVYDYVLHYAIGKVSMEDTIFKKLDKETFIIDKLIPIPLIKED